MNTYSKFVPNVFLAKCTEQHKKGEEIQATTRHGQNHACIIYNLIYERDGFFFYSIVRADRFNQQERAARKAERLQGYAANAEKKSTEYYDRAHQMVEHIPFGQPILVGHHSERAHRNLLSKSWDAMGKSVELSEKAASYESRIAYWKERANTINLSMPESIEYYEFEVEKLRNRHEGLKNGTIQRDNSFSLTYAKKDLNEAENKLKLAHKLWD